MRYIKIFVLNVCIVFSCCGKNPLEKIIKESPSAVLYCVNPYDCPNCFLGYFIANGEVGQYINAYWIFPANADSSDINYFIKEHFNISPKPSSIFRDDSLYQQFVKDGLSSIVLINKGNVVWQASLHDMQYYTFPKITNDTNRFFLTKQIDITKYHKNPGDKFFFINDSLMFFYNSLREKISKINIKNNNVLFNFSPKDSAFIDHLISISPVPKTRVDSNLISFRGKSSANEKSVINRLNLLNVKYYKNSIYVGLRLYISKQIIWSGQNATYLVPYDFLLQLDQSLNIKNIYAIEHKENNNGLFRGADDYSIIDSNEIYLPVFSKNMDSLISLNYFDRNNDSLKLGKIYPVHYPPQLPRKAKDGLDIQYGINVKVGYKNDVIYMFDSGLGLYDINDVHQKNLSPTLSELGTKYGLNDISEYLYLPPEEQSLLIMYKEGADTEITTNPDLYFCFLDKNYNLIESKPILFTKNAVSLLELPDGTIQLITEEDGKYILKIYKVF